jgi:predicted ester cyclase
MAFNFKDLIALWGQPLPPGDAAIEAFARYYSDPVTVNGTSLSLAQMVDRARGTQKTFADLKAVVLTQIDTIKNVTVVFRMSGRHVGPMVTPLGTIPPTGKTVERQIIDVLSIHDGRIHDVWMVADDLGALLQTGALTLK